MFEENEKKLEELRSKNQELVDKRFNSFVKDIKSEIDYYENTSNNILDRLGISKNKDIFLLVLIYTLIIIFGLIIFIPYHVNNLAIFFFGFVFFVAGMQIGLGKETRGFGLIFVFSHGGTGLGCIYASLLTDRFNTNVLTDLSSNMKAYLIATIALTIISFLSITIYNLSDIISWRKMSKVVILLLFALSIFLVGMLPVFNF